MHVSYSKCLKYLLQAVTKASCNCNNILRGRRSKPVWHLTNTKKPSRTSNVLIIIIIVEPFTYIRANRGLLSPWGDLIGTWGLHSSAHKKDSIIIICTHIQLLTCNYGIYNNAQILNFCLHTFYLECSTQLHSNQIWYDFDLKSWRVEQLLQQITLLSRAAPYRKWYHTR